MLSLGGSPSALMALIVCGLVLLYISISAVVCSRIAARKNRGTDEWFMCGELLGLIAVLAVLLLPRLPNRPWDGPSP